MMYRVVLYFHSFFYSHIQINLSFVTCALVHKSVPYNDLNFVIFKLILKCINVTSELELNPIVAPWHSIKIKLLMPLVFPWWIELLTWLCDFHVLLTIWTLLGVKFYNFWNVFWFFCVEMCCHIEWWLSMFYFEIYNENKKERKRNEKGAFFRTCIEVVATIAFNM